MKLLCCIAAAALAGAPFAFPVETKSWTHNSQADFERGTLKNLTLRSDGRLTLAPVFRELLDSPAAYLWALAVDSKGNLYAGGGGPGAASAKLTILEAGGKARTLAELTGLQIQSIAIDRKDRVFAATAPDGKVYRVGSDGKAEVFYDPKAKYIWSMVFNSRGDLFVATGDSGEIHRVTSDGKGSVFFRTEETHARSLAVDKSDNLIAGTEPGGLVLRISPTGQGFVLYQGARREVTAVGVASDGAIYAAAVGAKSPGGAPSGGTLSIAVPPQPSPPPAAPGAAPRTVTPVVSAQPAPPSSGATPSIAGGSEVYRIGADNYPQKVWSHPQDVVYAIAFDGAGRAVLGTGNKGNVYRIQSELVSSLLINAAPTQITAFATGPKGQLYAATGNVGKVYQIGPELEKQGTYESEPLDVGYFAYWGRMEHKADSPSGRVRFDTRSGNLDRPHNNWSPWAALDQAGRVTSPPARFLQYRLTLEAGSDGGSPEMRELDIAWMAKNVAPVLEEIDITPANYRYPPVTALAVTSTQNISLPPIGQRRRSLPSLSIDTSAGQSLQYAKGYNGARWSASDPNTDTLTYKVEIRGANEREWKLLRDKVREKYLSWESTSYPDGEYVLRVTASDAPDNPPDQALTTQLESERFTVDNTPPRISGLTGTRSSDKLTIAWRARDERSTIRRAEYSLNGGEWVVAQPSTRLSDAPELDYSVTLPVAAGETTVAVRVTDEYDNQTVDKVVAR